MSPRIFRTYEYSKLSVRLWTRLLARVVRQWRVGEGSAASGRA
jgi:hypothetical protein